MAFSPRPGFVMVAAGLWGIAMTRGVLAIIMVLVLAACEDGRLDGPDLRRLLAGNTIAGVTGDNRDYHVHFTPAGELHMAVEDGFVDFGRWRVTNDHRYCRRWERIGGGREACYSVNRNGARLTFEQGEERLPVIWIEGNPEQLPRSR